MHPYRGTCNRSPMRTIGDRVKERRAELNLSQPKLAHLVGVKYQTIQDLETNKSQGSKHIVALASALKTTPEWLLSEHGAKELGEDAQEFRRNDLPVVASPDMIIEVGGQEFVRIPIHDIRFAAGAGAENYDETPSDYYLMSHNLLRRYTASPLQYIKAFWASGDSMEKTIFDGDLCVADLSKTRLTNPGIYALVYDGDGLLKRASQHLETRAVTLISDNEKYPPQTITRPDVLQVVGRIIASIRKH